MDRRAFLGAVAAGAAIVPCGRAVGKSTKHAKDPDVYTTRRPPTVVVTGKPDAQGRPEFSLALKGGATPPQCRLNGVSLSLSPEEFASFRAAVALKLDSIFFPAALGNLITGEWFRRRVFGFTTAPNDVARALFGFEPAGLGDWFSQSDVGHIDFSAPVELRLAGVMEPMRMLLDAMQEKFFELDGKYKRIRREVLMLPYLPETGIVTATNREPSHPGVPLFEREALDRIHHFSFNFNGSGLNRSAIIMDGSS